MKQESRFLCYKFRSHSEVSLRKEQEKCTLYGLINRIQNKVHVNIAVLPRIGSMGVEVLIIS